MKKNAFLVVFFLILGAYIVTIFLNKYINVYEPYESYVTPYIWQTYKTKDLPEQAEEARESWISNNPDWKCELYDDDDIDKYIQRYWSKEMYSFYKALPVGVMKADLWRYLILKTHGGVYSDIDSKCLKPISEWEEEQKFDTKNILMIALENKEHFCQWTIYSTKEHPAMKYICEYILAKYEISGIDTTDKHFVHNTTGPAIWTEAIIEFLKSEGIVSSGKTSGEIFKEYKKTPGIFNEHGIYLLSEEYYKNIYSKNLYGSQTFGDGYVKWTDEVKNL